MDHVIIDRAYLRCSLDQGQRGHLYLQHHPSHTFIRQILHQSITFILILLTSISITQFRQYNTNLIFIQQSPSYLYLLTDYISRSCILLCLAYTMTLMMRFVASPGLQPVKPKVTPSPSPPPFTPQQAAVPPHRRRQKERNTRPSQGDTVLVNFVGPDHPDIATNAGQIPLNSASELEAM